MQLQALQDAWSRMDVGRTNNFLIHLCGCCIIQVSCHSHVGPDVGDLCDYALHQTLGTADTPDTKSQTRLDLIRLCLL